MRSVSSSSIDISVQPGIYGVCVVALGSSDSKKKAGAEMCEVRGCVMHGWSFHRMCPNVSERCDSHGPSTMTDGSDAGSIWYALEDSQAKGSTREASFKWQSTLGRSLIPPERRVHVPRDTLNSSDGSAILDGQKGKGDAVTCLSGVKDHRFSHCNGCTCICCSNNIVACCA